MVGELVKSCRDEVLIFSKCGIRWDDLRGGDGKAPWAMQAQTVPSRAREGHESVFAEKTEEALPSPPRENAS